MTRGYIVDRPARRPKTEYDYYLCDHAFVVRAKHGATDLSRVEMHTSWDEWAPVRLERGSIMTPVSEDGADKFWRTRIASKPRGGDPDASFENGIFRAFERALIRRSAS